MCRAPLSGGYVTSPIRNTISARIAAANNANQLSCQAFGYIINIHQDQMSEQRLEILARTFQESYNGFLDDHPLISESNNTRMVRNFHEYLNIRNPTWIADVTSTSAHDNQAIINIIKLGREFSLIGDVLLNDPSRRLIDIYHIFFSS